jgi:acyl carrier protein
MGSDADSDLSEDDRRRLESALAAVFRRAPIRVTLDMPLGAIEEWDSMNAVTFTMEIEEAFKVNLGETIFTRDQTIGQVLQVLRESVKTD